MHIARHFSRCWIYIRPVLSLHFMSLAGLNLLPLLDSGIILLCSTYRFFFSVLGQRFHRPLCAAICYGARGIIPSKELRARERLRLLWPVFATPRSCTDCKRPRSVLASHSGLDAIVSDAKVRKLSSGRNTCARRVGRFGRCWRWPSVGLRMQICGRETYPELRDTSGERKHVD